MRCPEINRPVCTQSSPTTHTKHTPPTQHSEALSSIRTTRRNASVHTYTHHERSGHRTLHTQSLPVTSQSAVSTYMVPHENLLLTRQCRPPLHSFRSVCWCGYSTT